MSTISNTASLISTNSTTPNQTVFPLYDIIQSQIGSKESLHSLSEKEYQYMIETVHKLDSLQQELCYALIRCHQLTNQHGNIMEIPYQIRKMKNGELRIDVRNLPVLLQHILFHFCKLQETTHSTN